MGELARFSLTLVLVDGLDRADSSHAAVLQKFAITADEGIRGALLAPIGGYLVLHTIDAL